MISLHASPQDCSVMIAYAVTCETNDCIASHRPSFAGWLAKRLVSSRKSNMHPHASLLVAFANVRPVRPPRSTTHDANSFARCMPSRRASLIDAPPDAAIAAVSLAMCVATFWYIFNTPSNDSIPNGVLLLFEGCGT